MAFKSLLYMSEIPPSSIGGQPLIVLKLLRDYDMTRLHVLCDSRFQRMGPAMQATFLACRHTAIHNVEGTSELRPRRAVTALANTVNALRIGTILRAGERIVRERGVEAILTVPWRCEFAIAAYRLSLATGIPLFVFETDDWAAMNPRGLPGRLVRRHQADLLRHAEKVWVISEELAGRYRERFGIDGEVLFHYLDPEPYESASARRERLSDDGVLRLVYTGAINTMFLDTMQALCDQINRGIELEGRRVQLDVYGSGMPAGFAGPHVRHHGMVVSEAIPEVLAAADACVIGVTFDRRPELVELVSTSIYTKTIDYLAARRPVVIVAPPYAAEVRYFRDVATIVDTADGDRIERALAGLARPDPAIDAQCERGVELVRTRHSLERRDEIFLWKFRSGGL